MNKEYYIKAFIIFAFSIVSLLNIMSGFYIVYMALKNIITFPAFTEIMYFDIIAMSMIITICIVGKVIRYLYPKIEILYRR